VVNFRQGLYEEAVITSSAKSARFPHGDRCTPARPKPPAQSQNPKVPTSTRQGFDQDAKQTPRRPAPSLSQGDRLGKENQSSGTNSCREFSLAPLSNLPKCSLSVAEKRAGVQVQLQGFILVLKLPPRGGFMLMSSHLYRPSRLVQWKVIIEPLMVAAALMRTRPRLRRTKSQRSY
jgi:hypothetical protein